MSAALQPRLEREELPTATGGGRPRRQLVALLLAIGVVVGLLMAEGALRLAAAMDEGLARELYDPTAVKIIAHGEEGFGPRPGASFTYRNGAVSTINALGWRGPEVAVPKPAGTLRIVLLGGSTSHGWGVDDDATIDAHLRRELAARYPSRRAEVVNLGFDGYDSYQDFERLRSHGMRLEPDVVIANAGINDVRNAKIPNLVDRDPRSMQWGPVLVRLRDEQRYGGPRPRTLVKKYLYLARVPSFVRDRMARLRNQRRMRAGGVAAPSGLASATLADSIAAANPQAADYFERNLWRIAELANTRGAALLLSTPPSALRYMPPTSRSSIEYWLTDAAATQSFRDSLDLRMHRVADSLSSAGRRAVHVRHELPQALFLDDCHLTPEGNAQVARNLADALAPMLSARGWPAPVTTAERGS